MTDSTSSIGGLPPVPYNNIKKETDCSDIGVTKNCCAYLAVGSILAAVGFTLLFHSPLNLATSTGLTKCIVGSVLASTGSLLIIYKVFVNCSACCKKNNEEDEVRKKIKADYAALLEAIKQHKKEEIARLLARGLDINRLDENGWAPLHYAAMRGSPEIIEQLVEAGAEVNMQSKAGTSWFGQGEVYPGQTPLHCALYRPANHEEFVLVSQRAKHNRLKPLESDENRRYEIASKLLSLRANPHIVDEQGVTAFTLAETFKYDRILSLLKGA